MADIPEYKRSTAIEPASQPLGFNQALTEFGQTQTVISNLGLQVAQRSSNEQARLAGLEAGKKPGRTLIPGTGEADQEFLKTYKAQEYDTVLRNGAQHIDNLYRQARRVGTAKAALDFDATAQLSIVELTKNLSSENKIAVTRDLQSGYLTARRDLEEHVYKKNQINQRDTFVGSLESLINIVNESMTKDTPEARENARIMTNDFIDKLDAYKDIFEEFQLRNFKRLLIENLSDSYERATANGLIKDGKMEQALKDLSKAPPTPNNLRTGEIYAATYKNHQAMVSAHDQLLSTQYTQKRIQGQLTQADMVMLQQELTPLAYAKFDLETSKWLLQQGKDQALFNEMSQASNSQQAMTKYTGSQKDKYFEMLVNLDQQQALANGEEYSQPLLRQARLAGRIKSPVPIVQERLATALKYGDVEEAAEAGMAVGALRRNNKIALQGFDKDAMAIANKFDTYRLAANQDPVEAAKLARGEVYVDDDTKASRLQEFQRLFNNQKKLNREDKLTNFVRNGLGASAGGWFSDATVWPRGLNTKVREIFPDYFARYGDWDQAKKQMFEDLADVYKHTDINNRDEIMVAPPEEMLPEVGYWQKNDMARSFAGLVDKINETKSNGGFVGQDIEWSNRPDFSNLLANDLVQGDLIANINGEARKVIVVSDDLTQLSADGRPSWAFYYINADGVPMPVIDASQIGGVARWYPDFSNLKETLGAIPDMLAQDEECYVQAQLAKAKGELEAQRKKTLEEITDVKSPYWWIP